jgi:hypothetical protein
MTSTSPDCAKPLAAGSAAAAAEPARNERRDSGFMVCNFAAARQWV